MDSVENTIHTIFENKTFVTVLSIILGIYSGAVAPALPNELIQLADTVLGKLVFTFLIGYLATRNVQLAIMAAVAFVVTLTVANGNKMEEAYRNFEHFDAAMPAMPDTFKSEPESHEDNSDHSTEPDHSNEPTGSPDHSDVDGSDQPAPVHQDDTKSDDSDESKKSDEKSEDFYGDAMPKDHDEDNHESFENFDGVVPAYNTSGDFNKNYARF